MAFHQFQYFDPDIESLLKDGQSVCVCVCILSRNLNIQGTTNGYELTRWDIPTRLTEYFSDAVVYTVCRPILVIDLSRKQVNTKEHCAATIVPPRSTLVYRMYVRNPFDVETIHNRHKDVKVYKDRTPYRVLTCTTFDWDVLESNEESFFCLLCFGLNHV